MTPFLSFDGMSAVDTSGSAPHASPLAHGELGKAFQKQLAKQDMPGGETPDQIMMASVNTDTTNASPITFLNLESGNVIDVEFDPAAPDATEFDNLQETPEASARPVASNIDPDSVEDTDPEETIPVAPAHEMTVSVGSREPATPAAKADIEVEVASIEPQHTDAPIEGFVEMAATDDALPVQATTAEPREATDAEPGAVMEPAIAHNAAEMGVPADPAGESDVEGPHPQQTAFITAATPQSTPSGQTAQDGTPQDRNSPDPNSVSPNTSASTESVQGFALGTATEVAGPTSDTGRASSLGLSAVTSTTPTISAPSMQAVVAPAQPQANYVAVPADIPSIISQELSSDTQSNRVRIQLDPPELGRVSLEFKFDSQGLQHVLVTADSAEAIRRIRAFHPDLVSVLDEHGLSSQDMTFREQASDQNPAQSWSNTDADALDNDSDNLADATSPLQQATPSRTVTNGLDIRV
jgi:flagellar hook-length control protein FliK